MNGPSGVGGFQAFTFHAQGRVDRIITPVDIFPPFDPKGVVPPGFRANALWDTGATKSVIVPAIVSALGLKATGPAVCETAGGTQNTSAHVINIGLPNRTLIIGIVASENGNLKGFEAIIGMDVIAAGDFAITNVDGKTSMSFRCPSIERIDYVAEHNRMILARVGRNDPCPCGKKKTDGHPMKFKNCCAMTLRT
jgi:predicted aspartyl protease